MRLNRSLRAVGTALVAAALLGAPLALAAPAGAGTFPTQYPVTTTLDVVNAGDGLTSLREAVSNANNDSNNDAVLELQNGVLYNLTICGGGTDEAANAGGDLDHTDAESLTVHGNGSTIRQTCSGERVLDKSGGTTLSLLSTTITGGQTSGSGGGIRAGGAAALSLTTVRGNQATQNGGGIDAGGSLQAFNSTITGNASSANGGGGFTDTTLASVSSTWVGNSAVLSGGAFRSQDDATVQQSTITQNRAEVTGGGFVTPNDASLSTATVVANRSPDGANLTVTGAFTMVSSIVALGSGGLDCAGSGTKASQGQNIGHDGSCAALTFASDVVGAHPMLSPLASNGGATQTMRPVWLSPAVDHDPAPCLGEATSQNGQNRPQGSGCESGSYEGTTADCTPAAFSDVAIGSTFFADICWLNLMGIAGGFPDGRYKPGQAVTRQSMSAFIYRLAGSPPFDDPLTPSFNDVAASSTFFSEVEWMAAEAITGGFPDGGFHPNQAVTRQAMAAFLYRIGGEPIFADPGTPSFGDVPLDHSFFHEVEWLAATGVTGGFADGTFRPSQAVTRQAMAVFLLRMAEDVVLAGL